MTQLGYSPADQTQYLVNRIHLADGMWELDPEIDAQATRYLADFKKLMGHTIGHSGVDLESRDIIIRREESNLGNFITDLLRTEYMVDFAFLNSGTFRKNGVIPAGPLSLLQIQECFPFNDTLIVLQMDGSVFKEALEWSVSAYPSEEGRFP